MKNIQQTVLINASPHEIYHAFLDSKIHSKITGSNAKIENKVGGLFSVWDGYATGKTLQLIPDKKIVQSWRTSDWDEKEISTITLELVKDIGGTKLEFSQINIPDRDCENIQNGWNQYYWEPMQKYFSKSK